MPSTWNEMRARHAPREDRVVERRARIDAEVRAYRLREIREEALGGVETWAQGPVVRCLYRRGDFGVVSWPAGDHRRLSNRGRDVITWVIDMYGSFSGDELSRMTHAEAPWGTTALATASATTSSPRMSTAWVRSPVAVGGTEPDVATVQRHHG